MADDSQARAIAGRFSGRTGGVLQALRAIVNERGYVSEADQRDVADVFNISQADLRGIVSFYEDLKTSPPARVRVRVCQAEACQSVGSRQLTRSIEAQLGLKLGEHDGEASLEAVYCLGLCAQGPTLTVNERAFVRADDADLATLLTP